MIGCVFSDTQLGVTSSYSLSRDGIGVREQDCYDAFNWAIDQIIAIKPDWVVHAGDLFDGIRPSNRAIRIAMDGLTRIFEQTDAHFMMIGGNHCAPRMASVIHIFDVIRSSLKRYADRFTIVNKGGVTAQAGLVNFHLIPYCFNSHDFAMAVADLEQSSTYNILVAHGTLKTSTPHPQLDTIVDDQFYRMKDEAALTILGHNHNPAWGGNVLVAGSTEIFGFDEVSPKYIYRIDHGAVAMDITPIQIPIRPVIDVAISCDTMMVNEIYEKVEQIQVQPESIIRVTMEGVQPDLVNVIDKKRIKEHLNAALYSIVRVKPAVPDEPDAEYCGELGEGMIESWDKFSADQDDQIRQDGRMRLEGVLG